jgi:hypothetical protein
VRSLLGLILVNFVKILKFVGCSKLMLKFNKFNKHSNLTINVTKFAFLKFIKLQFKLHSASIICLIKFCFLF